MQKELLRALAAIADLKEENYRLWLSLSTLTEALIARGLVTRQQLRDLSASLATADTAAALRLAASGRAASPALHFPPTTDGRSATVQGDDMSVQNGASPP